MPPQTFTLLQPHDLLDLGLGGRRLRVFRLQMRRVPTRLVGDGQGPWASFPRVQRLRQLGDVPALARSPAHLVPKAFRSTSPIFPKYHTLRLAMTFTTGSEAVARVLRVLPLDRAELLLTRR